MKSKAMICGICRAEIIPKIHNWNKVECYTRKKLDGTHYFHDTCYSSLLQGAIQKDVKHELDILLKRAHSMFDQMGIDKVVTIR